MRFELLLLSAVIFLIIPAGCSEDNPSEPTGYSADPSGKLVDFQGCKTSKQAGSFPGVGSDQDCVRYSYDSEGNLRLDHINAGFNCCPGDITADISIRNDTIFIAEAESDPACRCLCLFDVSYLIENLSPGEYYIRITGLYLNEEDQPVEFSVDLESRPSGMECFHRDHYPWDTGYSYREPEGKLIDYSGCKGTVTGISDVEVPEGLDCVECFYSGSNVLSLKHLNAAFNCCPGEIISDIVVRNDSIIITEDETEGLCDCICLFDLEYEIINIPTGEYTVLIREPYLCEGDQPLSFSIQLPCLPNYCHCEFRTCYPWETNYSEEQDLKRLSRMERILEQLLASPVCNSREDCIALPCGAKPCGGPGKYVAASRSSESFSILIPQLCIFNSFQDLVNHRYKYLSDCLFVTRPEVECRDGLCRIADRENRNSGR